MKKKSLQLALWIAACELAGSIGSVFTAPNIEGWYASLNKPFFTPPNWVFGPVWITLFCLMGIAAYLVWESKSKLKKEALCYFGGQFCLNVLWSLLFFGLRSPLYGLICIVLLWFAILLTIIKFKKVDKIAAWLLVPYLAWVTVATALNAAVWMLN
ncbi:MAG: TspO/MBR family protein [Candidatus Aenigmatarchaeota archaeon]